MSWTDERIESLRTMWEKGLTASQIADELGGVSRNAVIGKAHRLGLKSRPSPVKATEKVAKPIKAAAPVSPKPAAAPVSAPRAAAPVAPRPAAPAPKLTPGRPSTRRTPTADWAKSYLRPTSRASFRSAPAASSVRAPVTSKPRSRPRRRAGWCQRSRAPRSPTRRPCSTLTIASVAGRWGIRASPISISAVRP